MKKIGLLLVFSMIFSLFAFSAEQKQIPMDSTIRCGKLSNGLTYYIRHNEQPKQRAEFFIAQNVGAILEEDSQNGLAHFLEHMAFNGTKNYPGKKLINYFETIGVRFGANINAYTSLDETVYNLSEIPTYREGIIDSALLVLHDWSSFISLESKEIDDERGVIREEWRQGQNAGRRIWAASNKVILAGSQYAKRDVIGDTAIINNFNYQTLKDYYKKWYRPDLQAILIVGDVNIAQIEAKIKALFADIPAPVNPAKRIFYQIPDNTEPIVGVFTDPELQTSEVSLYFKQEPLSDAAKLTVEGLKISVLRSLISSMINNRFSEISQEPETPFTNIYSAIGAMTRTKDIFYFSCSPSTGKDKPARDRMLKEVETIKRFGFNASEMERVKTEILSSYEKMYKERNQQKNTNLVRRYASNFLSAVPAPSVEWEYNYIKGQLPQISIEEVNQLTRQYLGDKNIIYTIEGPQKEGITYPSNEELKQELLSAKNIELKPYKDNFSNKPLFQNKLKAGKTLNETTNESLGTKEWTLSNGIKIILKKTNFKEDEIRMFAWSDGGTSLLPVKDLPSSMYTCGVINQSGIGNFSSIELDKKLTGKIVSISPYINTYEEGLSGSSSVKDAETLLQLTNMYFTAIRKDENAYTNLIKESRTRLENAALEPKNAYSDSIRTISFDHHPRVVLNNIENLNKVDYASILRIYKDRFANPGDFTFSFIGNIDEKAFKPIVELYLGGLKTSSKKENWKDNTIRVKKGTLYQEIEKPLKVSKTTNFIRYTADLSYDMQNIVAIRFLDDLLSLRYTATIREQEGGSYGVGVNGYCEKKPVETGNLTISFDTDPKIYKKMLGIVHAEIKAMSEKGPKPEDLNKVRLNLIKQYNEDIADNGWWMQSISNYYRLKLNLPNDYLRVVNAITGPDIQLLAKKFLEQNNVIELLLMPEKK